METPVLTFIGDSHGKWGELREACGITAQEIYHVGDVGVGFGPYEPPLPPNLRFIRGNQDNPVTCWEHKQYLGDFGYDPSKKLFWCGGARSVDKSRRTPGVDWWPEEEFTYPALSDALELYEKSKPEIVMTHEAPQFLREIICSCVRADKPYTDKYGDPARYMTPVCFDTMLSRHRPKYWVHGHWHLSFRVKIKGTTFICLDELEVLEIEL